MWSCPVCGKENDGVFCAFCGFDTSRDYEHYPTLQKLKENPEAISELQRQYRLETSIESKLETLRGLGWEEDILVAIEEVLRGGAVPARNVPVTDDVCPEAVEVADEAPATGLRRLWNKLEPKMHWISYGLTVLLLILQYNLMQEYLYTQVYGWGSYGNVLYTVSVVLVGLVPLLLYRRAVRNPEKIASARVALRCVTVLRTVHILELIGYIAVIFYQMGLSKVIEFGDVFVALVAPFLVILLILAPGLDTYIFCSRYTDAIDKITIYGGYGSYYDGSYQYCGWVYILVMVLMILVVLLRIYGCGLLSRKLRARFGKIKLTGERKTYLDARDRTPIKLYVAALSISIMFVSMGLVDGLLYGFLGVVYLLMNGLLGGVPVLMYHIAQRDRENQKKKVLAGILCRVSKILRYVEWGIVVLYLLHSVTNGVAIMEDITESAVTMILFPGACVFRVLIDYLNYYSFSDLLYVLMTAAAVAISVLHYIKVVKIQKRLDVFRRAIE